MKGDAQYPFPRLSRGEWNALIEKELKGKSPDSVWWSVGKGWDIPPFAVREDISGTLRAGTKAINGWLIGEHITDSSDVNGATERINQAILGGVQVLRTGISALRAYDGDLAALPPVILEGHSKEVDQLLAEKPAINVHGGAFQDKPSPEQLERWTAARPQAGWLTLDGRTYLSGEYPGESIIYQLTRLLHLGHQFLEKVTLSPEDLNRQLRFCVSVSNLFFLEVAKLRALRILWANMLVAWGLPEPVHIPPIEVHADMHTFTEDPQSNIIKLTAQASAAVLGGCDLLFLPPADIIGSESEGGSASMARLSRNIQHILRLESHLDAVEDPAGGSYSVEQITNEMAVRAWEAFRKIIAPA
jgi:methylmalonyl-CoA mutase